LSKTGLKSIPIHQGPQLSRTTVNVETRGRWSLFRS
jgi:hypothetical protein